MVIFLWTKKYLFVRDLKTERKYNDYRKLRKRTNKSSILSITSILIKEVIKITALCKLNKDDILNRFVDLFGKHKALDVVCMKSNNKVKVVMYTNEDIYKLKSDLEKHDGKCNIYFTLNPIKPENLAKFLREGLSKGKSISDNEIEKYSLIPIEFRS